MATTYTDSTMGARAIGARTDNAGTPVSDVTAEEDRLVHEILTEGWVKPAASFQPVAGADATMNVLLGSGSAKADFFAVAGNIAGQGTYLVRHDATTTTVALNAADGSLARKDEIYLVVLDNAYDSTGLALPRLAYRDGTPAASPSGPGPDGSWDAYVLLATIDVPAAAADILACTITDERTAATLALGNFASDTSAVPNTIEPDDVASEGTAKTFSRSDHEHAIAAGAPGTIEPDDAAAEGVSPAFSRADHQHAIAAGAPDSLTPDLANAEGTDSAFARADHIHNVPAGAPGTIEPDDPAAEGAAASFARSDHQHAIATGEPVAIGTDNAEGASVQFARRNHVHAILDMSAVGVVIDHYTDTGVDTLAASYTDYASLAVTLPSGWNSAKVVAWGSVKARFLSSDGVYTSMNARMRIGTTYGSPTVASAELNNEFQGVAVPGVEKTISSNDTIYMQGNRSAGSQVEGANWDINYIMVRAS